MSRPAVPSGPRYALSPAQCRAARALLDWTLDDLAAHTGISKNSLYKFETGKSLPWASTIDTLRGCFEAAGVRFHAAEGEEGVIRVLAP